MTLTFPVLLERLALDFPGSVLGWTIALVWLSMILGASWKWGRANLRWTGNHILWFAILVVLAAVFNLGPGYTLPEFGGFVLPDQLGESSPRLLLILSAVPWVLAAGMLGPIPGLVTAVVGGIFRALIEFHQIYSILQIASVALFFGVSVHQRYRTKWFAVLRDPLGLFLPVMLVAVLCAGLSTAALIEGSTAVKLDYFGSQLPGLALIFGSELLIAATFAEVIKLSGKRYWGSQGALAPAPFERSLWAKAFAWFLLLSAGLLIGIFTVSWLVAGGTARRMIHDRMATAAHTAVNNIPFFLSTGQDLIMQIATDARLLSDARAVQVEALEDGLRSMPFFKELYLVEGGDDLKEGMGRALASSVDADFLFEQAPLKEIIALQNARNGVRVQSYAIPPPEAAEAAWVSFIGLVPEESEDGLSRIVIGRTELESNPFSKPVLASLETLSDLGGVGYLLDDSGDILYHPYRQTLMTNYPLEFRNEETEDLLDEHIGQDGKRYLVLTETARGRPWEVIFWVPAEQAQRMGLRIASPLLATGLVLVGMMLAVGYFGLQQITSSLKLLAVEAQQISRGNLDQPLEQAGIDEVGTLRQNFEQMRRNLKARLDELSQLLVISQSVASTFEIEKAVQPILKAARQTGVDYARVVLAPGLIPESGQAIGTSVLSLFLEGDEPAAALDEQILALARSQDQLVLTNPTRVRMLQFRPGEARPQALMATALRKDKEFYGAFWIGYKEPHLFSEEEFRYISTLAGQITLSASNARLFQTAEIGRQRLEAILDSSPDPVLVTDRSDRLLLGNPHAWQALGIFTEPALGSPLDEVIRNTNLLEVLRIGSKKNTCEVTLQDEKIYLAVASPILLEDEQIGRVCILRDVTRLKELDALKSEFVSTVSHDLRAPLAVMNGSITMIEMTGELNDQQNNYITKMRSGIDQMSKLVNNLLDLGKIEAGIEMSLEMFSLPGFLEKIVSGVQNTASAKKVELTLVVKPEQDLRIQADMGLLERAMQNLVDNAIKYTPMGGKIKVEYEVAGDQVRIKVADTGIGVAPIDQVRLFEKFFRVKRRGMESDHGTGLGLAIVKSIAERHHGQVGVESQLGRGSTFTIQIPLRQPKPLGETGQIFPKNGS